MWYSVGSLHRCINEMKNESKEMKNEIQRRWQDEMNCHNPKSERSAIWIFIWPPHLQGQNCRPWQTVVLCATEWEFERVL